MKKPVSKKKSAKTAKAAPKKLTLMDRLPKNHGEWLELVIKITDRAIGDPAHPDKGMVAQKARLVEELNAWKSANSK